MKTFLQLMIISLLMVLAAPAWSAEVLHSLQCQQSDEVSDEKVDAMTVEWLAAAKTVKGGENLQVRLNFPVAAKAGDVDLVIVLVTPSFTEWGTFMDNYAGSAAEAVDAKHMDGLDCGNGALWESISFK